ncbi:MAG TPA: hypothetical protein VGM17_09155 [Rhizomicrobium sp.]|jgi:hypothetical protein
MRDFIKLAVAGALAAGAFVAIPTTSASAAIACNRDGVCWHVRGRADYRPEFGVVVHPNGWRWGPREHYVFKEHRGRGYWRNGVWVTF